MFEVYTVKKGDNLETIARNIDINPDFLRAINGLSKNYILKENDSLVIPLRKKGAFDTYEVQKGDTLYNIAQKFNTDLDDLLLINGLNKEDYIYINQQLLVPSPNIGIYITKDGDTIQEISTKTNKNFIELLDQNQRLLLLPEQLIVYKLN